MKKALVLLALSLTMLPSMAANQRLYITGYRIGDSEIIPNDQRIVATNNNPEIKYDVIIVVGDNRLASNAYFNVSVPAGQEVKKWFAYDYDPTKRSPTVTNQFAGAETEYVWSYNSTDTTDRYVVVDFDYITYTLKYNGNGSTSGSMSSESHIYTNEFNLASNQFERTGYTFESWTNKAGMVFADEGTISSGAPFGITYTNTTTKTADLYAKWKANAYTVSYDANGGEGEMADQSFTYDQTQNLTSNIFTRAGYTFDGWAETPDGLKKYGDGQSVRNLKSEKDGEVTLYAKWSLVYYSLTTSMSGTGSGTVTLIPSGGSYTNGTEVVVTATPANGNTFTGWSDGVTDNQRTYTMTSNISVSAVFTIRTYTVTFEDYNGKVLLSRNCNWGDEMPFPEADPSREGYRFMGWTPTPPETVTRTATYSANYEAKKYTVKFHANYGSGTDTFEDQEFSYGTKQNLASVASLRFAKTGYSFAHWRDSDENTYSDGAEVINLATSGEFDLYAVWSPIAYTIAFDGNGAESGSVDSIDAEYDISYDLPKNGFVRSGFDFKGWRIGSASYGVGDSVSNLTAVAGETVTFSAVWSELRYVAFDGNGADNAGAMIDDVMTFDGIETKALVPNKFEKTGYTFGGWATNDTTAAALEDVYKDCADVVSTNLWMDAGETNVFYSVWQTNIYNVVFKRNGGNGNMAPQTFVYDQPQPLARCIFTNSLKFKGWATNETGAVVFGDESEVSNLSAAAGGEVNLYAVWDNGDLSKAMHCDNLVWVTEDSGSEWVPITGPSEGYAQSGSAVSNGVFWLQDTSDNMRSRQLRVDSSQPETQSGKLSFRYKTSCDYSGYYSLKFMGKEIAFSPEWNEYGPVEVGDIRDVSIILEQVNDNGDGCSVWIDQMTWVPDGVEPTEDDMPTINGFTATVDGFTLSVDDGNISDSFSYQILATNELVSGDWPVKTNLTAEAIKAGYDIVPEANEPKMFYKVKVISK